MRADFGCEEGQRNIPRCPGLDKKCSDHVSAETLESLELELALPSFWIAPLALCIGPLSTDRSSRSVDWFHRLFFAIGIEFARTLKDRRDTRMYYIPNFFPFEIIRFEIFYTRKGEGSEDGGWKFLFRNLKVTINLNRFLIVKNLSTRDI